MGAEAGSLSGAHMAILENSFSFARAMAPDVMTLPEQHREQVRAAQIARLFQQVPVNFLPNIASVAALIVVFHARIAPEWLIAWGVYAQVVNLSGLLLSRLQRRFGERLSNRAWGRCFLAYAAADAATWAAAAWLFFAIDSPVHTLVLSAVLLGTVAGGQTAFLSSIPVMLVFNLGITLSVSARFLVAGEPIYLLMAGLSFLFGVSMLRLGFHFHRNLMSTWGLRYELQDSEQALRESHDLLEDRVTQRTNELRLVNEDLGRSEALYRAVVEVQTELICRFLPGGRLSFVNDAFERFFELRRGKAVGNDFLTNDRDLAILDNEAAAAILQCVANLTPANPTGVCETRVGAPDDDERWLMWTHRALFDDRESVIEYQSVAIDITERMQAEQRITFLAHHDALTGLPNRLLLHQHLGETLSACRKRRGHCALLLIDLDDFKHVNDALGHYYGDALLKETAIRLQDCVRAGDLVARLGGDEFAIVQSEISSADEAEALSERILARLTESAVVDGQSLTVSASIGITLYPGDGEEGDALLKNADLALYRAKNKGRATHEFFSDDLANQAERRMALVSGLRAALDVPQEQFHMVYQPKERLSDGRLVGLEALLRWDHPEEGPIGPAEFVPVAESSGLSLALGDWVLDEVCRQQRAWLDAGKPVVPVSVNLSAAQFGDRRLLEKIRDSLTAHAIDPGLIDIEITETALMRDLELATEVSRGLVDIGLRLSIDDFGTGYSSFGYLRRLPVSELKIDRTFVINIAESASDKAILRAMADLGHSLGLEVLAEGIETEDQRQAIAEAGCDHGQGYLLSRPKRAEDVVLDTECEESRVTG